MSSDTFKSKLSKLIQKSRKALRIYSTATGSSVSRSSVKPFADQQISVWYKVNEELLEFLLEVTKNTHLRKVANDILKYAEHCQSQLVKERSKLSSLHLDLIACSQKADFVSTAKLSNELIYIKANIQANEAVLVELEDLLNYANIKLPVTHDLDKSNLEQSELSVTASKIIPFRKKQFILK